MGSYSLEHIQHTYNMLIQILRTCLFYFFPWLVILHKIMQQDFDWMFRKISKICLFVYFPWLYFLYKIISLCLFFLRLMKNMVLCSFKVIRGVLYFLYSTLTPYILGNK